MKKLLGLLMLVISSLTLIACTDSRVKIVFWHTMGKTTNPAEGGQALLNEFIKEWEVENPGYTIVHESKGGYPELLTSIGTVIPAGKEPDMAYCYSDHVAAYMRTGRVQPLNVFINDPELGYTQEEKDDFVTAFWNEGSVYDNTGEMYNLPFSKSTEVLFYNKTFFDANGLTMPASPTWEEILALCAQIKAKDNSKTPFGYDSADNLFITASEQLGIPYTAIADGVGQILFNNDKAKAMVEYFHEQFFKPGYLTTKDLLGGSYTSDEFKAGRLYMTVGSTGGTKYNIPENNAFSVGVVSAPYFGENIVSPGEETKNSVIQQGPSICMFKRTGDEERVKKTWSFLKYITSPEQSARFSMPSGYSPVTKSSYDTDGFKAFIELATTPLSPSATNAEKSIYYQTKAKYDVLMLTNELADRFFTSPAFQKSAITRTEVGHIFQQVFSGEKTVDEAFRAAYSNVTI